MGDAWGRVAMVLVVAGLIGCVDLPNVAREQCGNLVLDRDEDCDGSSAFSEETACGDPASANQCFYVCDSASSIVCPQGWGCGADSRCRRHSGTFEPAENSPYRFDVTEFAIGDVDGDGNLDLVGEDLGNLRVRFGDDDGDFSTEYVTSAGIVRGRVAFGKFSSDARTDVVLPLVEGISVFLGATDDTLEPVLFSPFSLDDVFGPEDFLVILPLEAVPEPVSPTTELMLLVDAYDDSGVYEGSIMAFFSDDGGAAALPGGHKADELVGNPAIANLDNDSQRRNEVVLAFRGADSVWIFTSTGGYVGNPLTPQLFAAIPLGTRRVNQGAHVGDFDGDGDLDIIISVDDGGTHEVMVSLNQGNGVFGVAMIQPIFRRGLASPFPIAVGDLDADAHADYVYPEAIYLSGRTDGQGGIPDTLLSIAQTQGQLWAEAVFGDFNGDGSMDVAASFTEEDGIDLFLNSPTLFPNRFRVGTTGRATKLRVGDFDGDTIGDVAFLQRGQGQGGDAVFVVFGGTDGPATDAIGMGKIGTIDTFEVLIAQTFIIDGISDLFVVSRTGPDLGVRSLALLQGSSAQHLSSPFTLLSEAANGDPDIPFQVLVGNFTADAVPDIVTIADVLTADTANGDRRFRLWVLPGANGEGAINTESVSALDIAGENFEAECAVWASGDLDGDGIEEIVGVDGSSGCPNRDFVRQPRLFIGKHPGGAAGEFASSIRDFSSNLRGIEELTLVDLDGDGDLDLLARFVGDLSSINIDNFTITGGGLLVMWNRQSTLTPGDVTTVEISGGPFLVGATAARLSDAVAPALMAVTFNGIYVAHLDASTASYDEAILSELVGGTGQISVGDLNKDGLDDVAYIVNRDVQVKLGQPAAPLGAAEL